jgi:glycosyltransferase involved in cell wall biosynthesis
MMPVLYRVADVFVLPSQGPGETWGLAVNEAMACKRAVLVSTKCGCASDLVEDAVNGYVFQSSDLNDLTNKMFLLVDSKKIRAMGAESFNKVQSFSYHDIIRSVEGVMQGLSLKNS